MQAPREQQRRIYVPWTPGIRPVWSVNSVRSALNAHEVGNFDESSKLIDAMGRDDRLSAVLGTRLSALLRSKFSMLPGDDDSNRASEIAEVAEEWWWSLVGEASLSELLRWYLMSGVAIGEIIWEHRSDAWVPRLKVWNMQWAWAYREERCYYLTTREGNIKVPMDGSDGKWVVLGSGDEPWMNGLVRCLAVPWLVRQFAVRDWARYSERHGMPIILADVPSVSSELEKDQFQDDIAILSTETTIQLPTNVDEDGAKFDLRLLEATDQNSDGFKDLIRHVDDSFAITLTGNNLTTQIDAGSLAAAQVGGEVKRERTMGDAQTLSTELRVQFLDWWVRYNYGDNSQDITPWPHWDVDPPVDLKLNAETLEHLGRAVAGLKAVDLTIDDIERFGVSRATEPGVAPQGPGPAPGDGDPMLPTDAGTVELAPTDIALVVTVDEARASQSLPPWHDPIEGAMTVAEFKARKEAAGDVAGEAEGEAEAEDIGPTIPIATSAWEDRAARAKKVGVKFAYWRLSPEHVDEGGAEPCEKLATSAGSGVISGLKKLGVDVDRVDTEGLYALSGYPDIPHKNCKCSPEKWQPSANQMLAR